MSQNANNTVMSIYWLFRLLTENIEQNLSGSNILGPWKFIRDIDSSNHWLLIMTPSQKANGDNLGISFRPSVQ